MDGMTTGRHGWMAGEEGRGTSAEEATYRRKDKGAPTWFRRVADAWWGGWIAFARAVGEPYLPLVGRAAPGSVTRNGRATPAREPEGERCA